MIHTVSRLSEHSEKRAAFRKRTRKNCWCL